MTQKRSSKGTRTAREATATFNVGGADGLNPVAPSNAHASTQPHPNQPSPEDHAPLDTLTAKHAADLLRANEALRLLSDVSAMLTSSLDYAPKLSSLARLVVPTLADWCVIDMIEEDGTIRRLAIAHADPAKHEAARYLQRTYQVLTSDANHTILDVIRNKQPQFKPHLTPERLASGARDAKHLALLEELGYKSEIVVPLIARAQVLGTITLVYGHSSRHHTEADCALAEELAQRVATSIDNARLYYAARQARQTAERTAQRTARLQAITAALSGALTPSEVADIALHQGLEALGADAGSVCLLNERGPDGAVLELVQAVGYSEELLRLYQRFSIDAPVPLAETVRHGEAIWLESAEQRRIRYPQLDNRASLSASWASLPLIVNSRALGALGLSFGVSRHFNEDDKAFMMALARLCAQALERARLYEEVESHAETLQQKVNERTHELQQALLLAQSAEQAKNALLATISHGMRTPLSSIQGFAHLALTRKLPAKKLKAYLSVIHSESRRLGALVDDFLDLQQFEAEVEGFQLRALDLRELINTIVREHPLADTVNNSVNSRQSGNSTNTGNSPHRLRLELTPVPLVQADGQRLQQVIINLLSNAIKYSPQGGEITISLRQEDHEVICTVRDQGMGIPPEKMGQLFERFWHGEAAEQFHNQGMGLGLALCKEIIQQHGGRIWAESSGTSQGATFSFALPV